MKQGKTIFSNINLLMVFVFSLLIGPNSFADASKNFNVTLNGQAFAVLSTEDNEAAFKTKLARLAEKNARSECEKALGAGHVHSWLERPALYRMGSTKEASRSPRLQKLRVP